MTTNPAANDAFLLAATWYGPIDEAEALRPSISEDIYTAAVLGDIATVERLLAEDPSRATASAGPRDCNALSYLCFSKYLQRDGATDSRYLQCAKTLLAAGASAVTSGFYDNDHQPKPEWESVIYGAAAVAQNGPLTQLLLDHGADPNDEETPYHAPESYDLTALKVLLDSGKLTPGSLAIMLVRKADWHDYGGMKLVLSHAADPNHITIWRFTALHQSVRRDNRIEMIKLLLDHGADPMIPSRADNLPPLAIAARRGRADILALLPDQARQLTGLDRIAAACALLQPVVIEPSEFDSFHRAAPALLAEFAGNGNTDGVAQLLQLGVPIDALYQGDAYFAIAPDSTALHVAAWRARPDTVRYLIEHGADVNARNARGEAPLDLAIRAATDSYWTNRRTPDSVEALLSAGADATHVQIPTGYEAIDPLIQARRAG